MTLAIGEVLGIRNPYPIAVDDVGRVYIANLNDGPNLDAFGRLRTSATGQRADIEFIYDKQPDLIDEVTSGAGTATFNSSPRDVTLAVVDTANDSAAGMYSYDVPYTPGNSQLVDITGTMDNAAIGGGEIFIFLRSPLVAGGEITVDQADWNMDSVTDADWTKSQIFSIDFQSLKVGRLRLGLVRNGLPVYLHQFYNDNRRSTGYWQLPSLPFYWRIYNDATYTYSEMAYGDTTNAVGFRYRLPKNATATMRAICATVKSEGGQQLFEMPGFQRSVSNFTTAKTVSSTQIPILSIRPTATFNSLANRGLYIPTAISLQANNPIYYEVLYRPTLTGASWTAVNTAASGMEYDVTASALATSGIRIEADYGGTGGNNVRSLSSGILGRTLLKLGRTGVSDILTISAVRTTNSDSTVYASIEWREIR